MSKQDVRTYTLDLPRVASIEYPLNVQNVDKALAMTGGPKTVQSKIMGLEPLELRLRPQDPYHHPVEGKLVYTDNLLVKVSVSKKKFHEEYGGDLKRYLAAVREQKKRFFEEREREKEKEINNGKSKPDSSNGHDTGATETNTNENDDDNEPSFSAAEYNEKVSLLKAEPVGIINKTYRFRGMMDYQYTNKASNFACQVESSVLTGDLDALKKLDLSIDEYPWSANNHPVKNEDLHFPPPPIFSNIRVPALYNYRQNNMTITTKNPETGETSVVAINKSKKLYSIILTWEDKEVPRGPHPSLNQTWDEWKTHVSSVVTTAAPRLSLDAAEILKAAFPAQTKMCFKDAAVPDSLRPELLRESETRTAFRNLQCTELLQRLFQERPLYQRKELVLALPREHRKNLRACLPFAGYAFRKGPWRSVTIRFGLDPRRDPRYAEYQRETFKLPGVQTKELLENEYFDKIVSDDERQQLFEFWGDVFPKTFSFFVKDLRDPDVQRIFEVNKHNLYKKEADVTNGWYQEHVLAAVRKLIKYKLPKLYREQPVPTDGVEDIIQASTVPDKNNEEADDDDEDEEEDDDDDENEDEDDEEDEGEEETNNVEEDGADQDSQPMDIDAPHENGDPGEALLLGSNEEDLLVRLKKTNPKYYEEVKNLVGIIKEDDIDLDKF